MIIDCARYKMKTASNIFELIGKTPMVRISKMNPNSNVEIYTEAGRI